jgi:hypothetical protein
MDINGNKVRLCGLNSCDLGYGPVLGSFEHGIEHLRSIKVREVN